MEHKTDKLISALSQMYFYEELHLEDLCYFPRENPEGNLPDLVLNLGNSMVMIKIECCPRGADQKDWVREICGSQRLAMQNILSRVLEGSLPELYNRKGEPAHLAKQLSAFPILILHGISQDTEYPALLEKYSPEALIVNCMRLEDFQRACGTLTMPMELMHFLYYRACFYGDLSTVTKAFQRKIEKEQTISEVDLMYEFLAEKYSYYPSNPAKFRLEEFREFLRILPTEKVLSFNKTYMDVIRFLTHLSRSEVSAFMERIEMLTEETKRGSGGLLSSLRPKDDRYAIFFAAKQAFPLPVLREMIYGCDRVRQVLEVVGRKEADGTLAVEFELTDHF